MPTIRVNPVLVPLLMSVPRKHYGCKSLKETDQIRMFYWKTKNLIRIRKNTNLLTGSGPATKEKQTNGSRSATLQIK